MVPGESLLPRSFIFFLEFLFQPAQSLEPMAFVFSNPTLVDLLNRDRIEVVEFLSSMPDDNDELRLLQQCHVLGDRLTRHVQVLTQFVQRQAILFVKPVKQISAARIGKRFEN